MSDLVLYGYWRSSSSYRVRIALAHKGIAHRSVAVNLLAKEQSAPEHVARAPHAYIPCLVVDGRPFIESVAILELLEDLYPRPALYPRDPWDRARVRALVEIVNAGTQPLQNLNVLERVSADPSERTAWAKHYNERGIASFERAMEANAALGIEGRYAYGDFFSAADVFLVPQVYSARRFGVDLTPYPRVRAAYEAALALPFVRDAAPERQADAPKAALPDVGASARDATLERARAVLEPIAAKTRVLEAIAWPRSVEHAFFARGASELPEPEYAIDRAAASDALVALGDLRRTLEGEHPLHAWLRRQCDSFIAAQRLLLAVGTPEFGRASREIFGGAKTTAFDHDTTNLDLAEHVIRRVGAAAARVDGEELDTSAFVALLERRLAERAKHGAALEMTIERDPDLAAKVVAGRTRLRVREGATFSRAEAEGLYLHEIDTHALTAQNGAAQTKFPLLKGGGPRTTRTQEGLAVFSELWGHALSSPRLLRLAERVRLIAMAEDGASFLDLYRHLRSTGLAEREAWFDAQRICRGGVPSGGAPFTKDACYLAGLFDVYSFLRAALRAQAPVLGEALVCGRIALEDVDALLWLRAEGVLGPPKMLPRWVERFDALVSYFAFTSFLSEVEVAARPSTEAMDRLVERAMDAYRSPAR
jgi:maleylacetoacetate isomerase